MTKTHKEFNGKKYTKRKKIYNTENKAKKDAKHIRNMNFNVIIDKDKKGWFLWIRSKRKPKRPEYVIHTR